MFHVARFHDPALGIGHFARRLGFWAARLFSGVPLGLPGGLLGLVLWLLGRRQYLGPLFDHGSRLLQGGHALVSPRQFGRKIQSFPTFPGFGEAMRMESLKITRNAILSRNLAVVVDKALVICLPGKPSGGGISGFCRRRDFPLRRSLAGSADELLISSEKQLARSR
jgi:hypothetical protein